MEKALGAVGGAVRGFALNAQTELVSNMSGISGVVLVESWKRKYLA